MRDRVVSVTCDWWAPLLGPSSEQTKGKLPVTDRMSPQASVSAAGICMRYILNTLLLCVILKQMLANLHWDLSLSSMTHILDQLPLCTECTVILLPPLPLCVTPSPSGHRQPPSLWPRRVRRAAPGGAGATEERRQFSPNFLSPLASSPLKLSSPAAKHNAFNS